LDIVEKRKMSPARDQTPVVQPVALHYTNSAMPAPAEPRINLNPSRISSNYMYLL
jgi:hypothetical protein